MNAPFDTLVDTLEYNIESDKTKYVANALNACNYFYTKYNATANHLQLDSYMLDVDDLQLGAFRFIRS